MTIPAQTGSQTQTTLPLDAAAPEICANWMVAAPPANDRCQPDIAASNIVVFRPRADGAVHGRSHAASAPNVPERLGDAERPAPPLTLRVRSSMVAPLLIGISLLCHALALAYFAGHAPPRAIAIGEKPILVELIAGASATSGFSGKAAESSIAAQGAQAARGQPRNEREPQSEPPDEIMTPAPQTPAPRESALQENTSSVSKVAISAPVDKAIMPLSRSAPPVAHAPAPAKPKSSRNVTRERRDDTKRAALASPASAQAHAARASASASATNYYGQVARHLQRFKRTPVEARARGASGIASVAFSVNGAGGAHAVRLVRSSGHASIDQEALAMVRRASPFPQPPDGQTVSFTVPVNISMR